MRLNLEKPFTKRTVEWLKVNVLSSSPSTTEREREREKERKRESWTRDSWTFLVCTPSVTG
jgi:hypothetical protein